MCHPRHHCARRPLRRHGLSVALGLHSCATEMQRELINNWNLGEEWAAWHADHPESDLREDAHVLGVSEAELLATGCGESVTRLQGGWIELLRGLQELGPVTVQTQSDGSIIEALSVAGLEKGAFTRVP